ncbi:MAG: hypothetical protein H7343_10575 [Undibacterium sp.]|nr:hypothetical protein [Opitutaceae bacterium]
MRRTIPLLVLAFAVGLIVAPFALAAETKPGAREAAVQALPAAPLAAAISTITSIAISPLLGTGAYGAYQWFAAEDEAARAALPWYSHWSFWGPALAIAGLCALKDALGTVLPPGLKKPFDVLETIENKAAGFVAAAAVVPMTSAAAANLMLGAKTAGAAGGLVPSGLAMVHVGMIDFPWWLGVLLVPLGVAAFTVVWMASHAINVLILLSPWGAIDAALKVARTALLGLLVLTALVNPWVGAALALAVIVVAWLVAGWAFRLTFFGTVFCWDFFTVRRARFRPRENDNRMFAGGNLPGVSPRTYGRLVLRTAGGIEFYYRPWLVLPERSATVAVDKARLAVGKGLFFSSITADDRDTLFLLPPRYHGHEEMIVRAYFLGGGVRAAGLRRAWSVAKELFGGSAAQTQVV